MPLTPIGCWLLLAWLGMLGACFGSFLNVVIYRLPRGENLAHPGSRCPRCGRAIALWDNIPVLSWLLLRGRCRCCRQPISIRYPLVELAGGTMAVLFAPREILYGVAADEVWFTLRDPLPTAFAFWAARLAVGLTLLAVALIRFDGRDAGVRLYLPAMLLFPAAVCLELNVPSSPRVEWGAAAGYYAGGVVITVAAWWELLRLLPIANDPQEGAERRARTGVVGLLALVHGALGLPLAGIPLAWVGFAVAAFRRRRPGPCSAVPLGVLLAFGWLLLEPQARVWGYVPALPLVTGYGSRITEWVLIALLLIAARVGEWWIGGTSSLATITTNEKESSS